MNNDIIKQIQQEYRIADDGSVTLSIRGVARLAGISSQALVKQFSLSIREVARLAGVDQSSLGNLLQKDTKKPSKLTEFLKEQGFDGIDFSQFAKTGIPQIIALGIIRYYYQKGKCTELGCKLIGMPMLSGRSPSKLSQKKTPSLKGKEKEIQQRMLQELQAKKEVLTEAGNIDLLTSTELIEIKAVKSWKSGLGQLLVYGDCYPSHSKRLHLFGTCHSSYLEIVKKHCDRFNITVTWEA